jgi:hypothetical protein
LSKVIDDNQIYMPFMFEDLRMKPSQYLYFRAFLKPGLSEMFAPEWQTERYYGRVDQVPIYMGTTRTVNVAFDVVAWSPADLIVIWKKLKKLQSMVYPMYDVKGFMSAGPIIRMRIGDLIATTNGRGLPGYITSMDWSYDDGIWNITKDEKVPRKVSVSLGYTILHEGNVGVYPYTKNTVMDKDDDLTATSTSKIENVFGAAKISRNTSNDGTTTEVSQENVRKIFGGSNKGGVS